MKYSVAFRKQNGKRHYAIVEDAGGPEEARQLALSQPDVTMALVGIPNKKDKKRED